MRRPWSYAVAPRGIFHVDCVTPQAGATARSASCAIWDAATGQDRPVATIEADRIAGLSVSPDGRSIVYGRSPGTCRPDDDRELPLSLRQVLARAGQPKSRGLGVCRHLAVRVGPPAARTRNVTGTCPSQITSPSESDDRRGQLLALEERPVLAAQVLEDRLATRHDDSGVTA